MAEAFTERLYKAIGSGDITQVQGCIDQKADVNAKSSGWPMLCLAAANGFNAIVELLIKYNANIHATIPEGGTAFFIACQEGDFAVVETLIEHNMFTNQ